MSHWTSIKTQIRDVSALAHACAELGFAFKTKSPARGYYGTRTEDYTIEMPKDCPYDVIVKKEADGTYALLTDWHLGYVKEQVGEGFKKIIQAYGIHKTIAEAQKRGLQVQRQKLANGAVKLSISGGNL